MSTSTRTPLHVFRFHVEFHAQPLSGPAGKEVRVAEGAFAECSGLEATMEPKVIREGGANHGAHQRVGPVTFGTVILRRGMTRSQPMWSWWDLVTAKGAYAYRLTVTIHQHDNAGKAVHAWVLTKALPVKFKTADLNARGSEVGIEELHLAHEGLAWIAPKGRALKTAHPSQPRRAS